MYFKEKENTNIDGEFQGKQGFDFQKYKPLIIIGGGVLLLLIIVIVAFSLRKPNDQNPTNDDSIAYNLELTGDMSVIITLGNDYIEAGYKAYDNNGNDVTNQVKINSNIKVNEIGNYEIVYTIGNQEKIRNVEIKEQPQETYIYLKGSKNIYLDINEKYVEPGFVSHDTLDGSLTDKVKVTGSVNSGKKGLYKIVYSVINSRDITTQVERNVIVGEKKPTQ